MKIALFDDHLIVTEGLKRLFSMYEEYEVVGSSTEHDDFINLVTSKKPNIAIVDIINDDHIGLDLFEDLLRKFKDLKVIGYSSVKNPIILHHLVSLGIHGFARKNGNINALMDALEAVTEGKTFYDFEVDRSALEIDGKPPVFTKKERTILEDLYKGLTSKEIANKHFLSPNTVNNHRKNMMKKFQCKNTMELLSMAVKLGILI